jgi:hypothetical protein
MTQQWYTQNMLQTVWLRFLGTFKLLSAVSCHDLQAASVSHAQPEQVKLLNQETLFRRGIPAHARRGLESLAP